MECVLAKLELREKEIVNRIKEIHREAAARELRGLRFKTFRGDKGFEITYPETWPVNAKSTKAFEAENFVVDIDPAKTTKASCVLHDEDLPDAKFHVGTKSIGGKAFEHYARPDMGKDSWEITDFYLKFQNGHCYDIEVLTEGRNCAPGVHRPDIAECNLKQWPEEHPVLDEKVLQSFRMSGAG